MAILTEEHKRKISLSKKGKFGYIGKINCQICLKEIIVYTTQQMFCSNCKKLHTNKWRREYLSKEYNKNKHHVRCEKWRNNNLDKKAIYQKRYILNNPIIAMAQNKAKVIPLNQDCEICHSVNNLQRHHWRYDKPLLINTLCQTCHNVQHIKHFETSVFGRY